MTELIYDVYWEGPFDWDDVEDQLRECHVLYQIYGPHPLYGGQVLLYIGGSEREDIGETLAELEDSWVGDLTGPALVRLGAVGEFTTWEDWSEKEDYEKARPEIANRIEALLILAHQPAFNSDPTDQAGFTEGFRVFNTYHRGDLFPEISYKYFQPIETE